LVSVAAALAVVLTLGAAAVLSFVEFDGERFKARLAAEVAARTGRALSIDGAVRLKILPRLAVEINQLRLSAPPGGQEKDSADDFLRIGQARGALEIFPLLYGKIVITRVEIREVALFAERYADGSSNFDDLLRLGEDDTPEDAPLQLEVGEFALLSGALHWRDAALGKEMEARELFLLTDAIGEKAKGRLQARGNITAQPLREAKNSADSAEAASWNFTLTGIYQLEFGAGKLRLDALNFSLAETRGKTAPRAEVFHAQGGLRQALLGWAPVSFSLQGLRAEGGAGGKSSRQENPASFHAFFALESLSWQLAENGARQGELLGLDFRLTRPRSGGEEDALEIALPAIKETQKGRWRGEGKARLRGREGGAKWQGELAVPLDLEALAEKPGVRLAIPALTGTLAGTPEDAAREGLRREVSLRLGGAAEFSLWQDENAAWQGAGAGEHHLTLGESHLDILWKTASAAFPQAGFQTQFEARLDRLDADAYWRSRDTEEGAPEKQKPSSQESVNFSALGEVTGVLTADWIRLGGMELRNLESRARLSGETLIFSPSSEKTSEMRGNTENRAGAKGF
jgi:hypothetical protein